LLEKITDTQIKTTVHTIVTEKGGLGRGSWTNHFFKRDISKSGRMLEKTSSGSKRSLLKRGLSRQGKSKEEGEGFREEPEKRPLQERSSAKAEKERDLKK